MQSLHVSESIRPNLIQNTTTKGHNSKKLRVVTLNYLPSAYKLVTEWITENGHEHVLGLQIK